MTAEAPAPKPMGLWCWHRWEKWKPYTWVGKISFRNGTDVDATEDRQKRVCEKCGKTQDERVN